MPSTVRQSSRTPHVEADDLARVVGLAQGDRVVGERVAFEGGGLSGGHGAALRPEGERALGGQVAAGGGGRQIALRGHVQADQVGHSLAEQGADGVRRVVRVPGAVTRPQQMPDVVDQAG